MEVSLDKRYPVAAGIEQAWAVLKDVRATAACMPGAAITEQTDDTHYKGTVKSKVGPSTLLFGGDIEVLGLDEAARELHMVGKGADKSGSSASMDLTAHLEPAETQDTCTLVGRAVVKVNGKLAQFGSRLLVPVSDVMLGQFADNFSAAAAAAMTRPAVVEAPAQQVDAAPQAQPSAVPPSQQIDTPPAPAPAKELNALALAWAVFKSWLRGLFGSRA
jgi:carbon monoxide dehydrogenase subunit G